MKHPEFILIPPPIEPGIHDINSNPEMLLSFANSETFFCEAAVPATIVLLFSKVIFEKLLPNFITVPWYVSSSNNTFEPFPKINILPLLA